MNRVALRYVTLLAALLCAMATSAYAGESFGMSKKIAKLVRVNPPQVHILGVRIAVHASSQGGRHDSLAQRWQSQLESQLVGNDPRLVIETKEPETVVDLTVLQSEY